MSEIETQSRERYNSSSFSVIGADAVYRGDIEFEGVLHINGDFYGNIKGNGDLGVGLTGRVKSVVQANNVLVSGLVWGNIIALGRVGIKSSAIVIGNIRAASLVVEEGSILHGKLEISGQTKGKKIAAPALVSYRKDSGNTEERLLADPAANVVPSTDSTDSTIAAESQGGSHKAEPGEGKYSVWK